MNLLVLGPQGSGKGTQAKRIAADHGIPHVSTGDMFRAAIAAGTPLGVEVEAVLATHPSVAEAAVIGVPDEIYGEAVAAFVEPSGAAQRDAQALIDHCRSRLAGYKKPKHVIFIDTLPRNSTGKVLKNELRALAAERLNRA